LGIQFTVEAVRAFWLSDRAGFQGQKHMNDGSKPGANPTGGPSRLPEEAATPKPNLADEDVDPPAIATRRAEAAKFLEPFGPLPWPTGEPEDQNAARRLRQKL